MARRLTVNAIATERFPADATKLRRRILIEFSALRRPRARTSAWAVYVLGAVATMAWFVAIAVTSGETGPWFAAGVWPLLCIWIFIGMRDSAVKEWLPKDSAGGVTLKTLNDFRAKRRKRSSICRRGLTVLIAVWMAFWLHSGIQAGGDELLREIGLVCLFAGFLLMGSAIRLRLMPNARCVSCDWLAHPRERACRHCGHDFASIYAMYLPKRVDINRLALGAFVVVCGAFVVLTLIAGPSETTSP